MIDHAIYSLQIYVVAMVVVAATLVALDTAQGLSRWLRQ